MSEQRSGRFSRLMNAGEKPQQETHEPTPQPGGDHPEPTTTGGAVDFDNRKQLERIEGGLIPGERLYAVYDMKGAGTGFVGITDRRLIIQDEGRIRKRRSLVSIPYARITMIASADEGGILRRTSELTIYAGSQEFEMDFRSADKAERAYTFILQHIT